MTKAELLHEYQVIIPNALEGIAKYNATFEKEVQEVKEKRANGTLNIKPYSHYARTKFAAFTANGEYNLIDPVQSEQQGLSSFDKQKISEGEYFLATGIALGHVEAATAGKPEMQAYKRLHRASGGIAVKILTAKIVVSIEGVVVFDQECFALQPYGADEYLFKAIRPFLLKGGKKIEAKLKLAGNIAATSGSGPDNDEFVELLLDGYTMRDK